MFCEKCGTKMNEAGKEFHCPACQFIKYFNPIPVAVSLIRINDDGIIKFLGVLRKDNQMLALPGGFQELEDISDCAKREVYEETGLDLTGSYHEDVLVLTVPNKNRNLMFMLYNDIVDKSEINFNYSSNETEKPVLIDETSKLAFPLHEKAIKYFINKIK